jgi:hypothetical protein
VLFTCSKWSHHACQCCAPKAACRQCKLAHASPLTGMCADISCKSQLASQFNLSNIPWKFFWTCTNVCASPRLDLHKPMCVMHKWLKNMIPLFGMQRALRKSSALEWAHVIHLHFCYCHHSTQDNHTTSGKLLSKDV